MIKPTIGRVVWFYPRGKGSNIFLLDTENPVAALITYVHNDRLINIGGFDHQGFPYTANQIQLVQDDDVVKQDENYCTWMPYQLGQAAKTEELMLKATPFDPISEQALRDIIKRQELPDYKGKD